MAAILITSPQGRFLTFSLFNTPFLPLSRPTSSKLLLRNGISSPKLLNSTLSLHSSTPYALGNFGLVSTTECPDGSLVFHFGNVSEKERNAQVEESRVVHGAVQDSKVKVGGGLVKQDTEDGHAVEVPSVDHELETVDIDSPQKREKRNHPDQVLDIVNLRKVEKENHIVFDCHTFDVNTNLHSNENSIENDNQKQISSPASMSECNDGVTGESNRVSVSKVSSEQSSKIKDVAVMSDDVVIGENSTASVYGQNSRSEDLTVLSDDNETVENSKASVSEVSSEQSSRNKDIIVLSNGGETVKNSRDSASEVSSEQSSRNKDVTLLSGDGGRTENSKTSVSEVSSEQSTETKDVTVLSIDGVTGENGTASVSEMSSEQSNRTEDVAISNIASMLDSMYDGTKVSSSFEDSQKTIESEAVTLSSSSETVLGTPTYAAGVIEVIAKSISMILATVLFSAVGAGLRSGTRGLELPTTGEKIMKTSFKSSCLPTFVYHALRGATRVGKVAYFSCYQHPASPMSIMGPSWAELDPVEGERDYVGEGPGGLVAVPSYMVEGSGGLVTVPSYMVEAPDCTAARGNLLGSFLAIQDTGLSRLNLKWLMIKGEIH
ncbi:probable protein phosphatase 2C 62 [Carica papaya]|uniref:probable protein phosphatase 2C 62 n=1 Tax=Carica papaya TaxID=3649 RepID=UPI000B8CBF07|nr:probable protein phosphatase 2C 62 [Carica papaya]